ncbi:MAG: MFS transporter, partial [Syntrophomonadaceae bacterium]|nr:MFS transporter [Syntrophomonadaceae bacterium]
VSFYSLIPVLPKFVIEILHGTENQVGYVIGILSITSLLFRPISGYLLDTIGRKKTLFFGLLFFALAMGTYNLVTSLWFLLMLRSLHGISWSFSTTGTSTLAADIVPKARRGEGLGYYGLSYTLAMAFGPTIGLFILSQKDFSCLFTTALILSAISVACLLAISYSEDFSKPSKGTIQPTSFYEPSVLPLSAIILAINFVYGGIVSFITLYSEQIGILDGGIYFMAYALTLFVVRPGAGRFYDMHGPVSIMTTGFIALFLAFILLFAANSNGFFIASAITMGLGIGIIQPTCIAMAMNRVPPHRRGATNATVLAAIDLGIGSGSILLGIVSNYMGLADMYLYSSLVVILPATIFYLIEVPAYKTKIKQKAVSQKE